MCTSISFSSPVALFGRNLDLDVSFDEQVVVTPRHFPFHFKKAPAMPSHFAMIGMATIAEETPLYAEAANEKGVYAAGLNFPQNAYYAPQATRGRTALAPYELIPFVLGQCENLAQVRSILEDVSLVSIPFSAGYPLAPLHWHIADQTGSITVEPMKDGLKIYDNPAGVLTNNPPFPFQMMNLNNYMHLRTSAPVNHFSSGVPLRAYGQGMGAMGLPGDFSPMSRFVKATFLKCNSVFGKEPFSTITQFFHILDAVAMVRGSVVTDANRNDITRYSCCIDAAMGIYYYKTYENSRIHAVSLFHEQLDGDEWKAFPLDNRQQILFQNKGKAVSR